MKINDKRPELFIRSECNIWLDPYIQQRMLEEHLNPQSDGASRSRESVKKTIEFLETHISPRSKVLDLGCGPGLYAELLSNSGHQVTGIDFNSASVKHALKRGNAINYICGDYITDFPVGQYESVLLIYCDFGALTELEGEHLVKNVYESLNKNGKFIFDFFDQKLTDYRKEEKNWEYAPHGGFWSENEYILLSQTFHYPSKMTYAYQYNLIKNGNFKHFIVWERYFKKTQISRILSNAGFRDIKFFESVCNSNSFTCSDEIFVVAQK